MFTHVKLMSNNSTVYYHPETRVNDCLLFTHLWGKKIHKKSRAYTENTENISG